MPRQPYLYRNELGWRVPKEGTKSHAIYELHLQGVKARSIAIKLDMNETTVRVLIHRFKHPDLVNKYERDRAWLRYQEQKGITDAVRKEA